ncbi:hypothetical protein FLAN108750_00725 [Flavobacterium antarcticum]
MRKENTLGEQASPDVGLLLERFIKERRIFKSALARKLRVRPQTVQTYLKKSTMQSETIWQLSVALQHNFLQDLADQLPKEFSTYVTKDTSLQEKCAALEEELKITKAQLAVLKELMQRG